MMAAIWARFFGTSPTPVEPEVVVAIEPASQPKDNIELALDVAAALCRRFEGFYSRPYMCPAGVPTIGYGATYYEDGTRVTLKDAAISKMRAEELLLFHLRTVYMPSVIKLCPNITDADRLAAIIDWTFNLGATNLKNSTMRRKINANDWDGAAVEIVKWVRAGGKILRGLVIRREAERDLINKP